MSVSTSTHVLARCPADVLASGPALLAWLDRHGLRRPTLAEIDHWRRRRGIQTRWAK